MSNLKKQYIINALYGAGYMFCSGAILQTFLLQAGFSEHQVYLYNSLIQLLQVATMIAMVFLSDRIGRVKTVVAFTGLSLVATATVFIIGAFNPALFGDAYVAYVFVTSGISYVGVGVYSILLYVLPFVTIDMSSYGKMSAISTALTGAVSFGLSFVHIVVVSNFDYLRSMGWFFILAIICFVMASVTCFSMKELPVSDALPREKSNLTSVFKNKDTYILLLPNFARGLAAGITGVVTVFAISKGIVDEKTSSYVNIVMQVAMFIGNIALAFLSNRVRNGTILIVSTIGCCVFLPICLNGGTVLFLTLFFVAYLFRMIIDTAIPVLIPEIIPKEQIGAFTSIRMLTFIGAQGVATLIISPLIGVIGYVGILIFAAAMQFVCGFVYWLVSLSKSGRAATGSA